MLFNPIVLINRVSIQYLVDAFVYLLQESESVEKERHTWRDCTNYSALRYSSFTLAGTRAALINYVATSVCLQVHNVGHIAEKVRAFFLEMLHAIVAADHEDEIHKREKSQERKSKPAQPCVLMLFKL